jgi:hypothetical protein
LPQRCEAALALALTGVLACHIGTQGERPPPGTADAGADASLSPGKISVVAAQGAMGRTTISCDDGKTWIRDRSWITEASDLVCGNSVPVRCDVTSCNFKNQNGICETHEKCDCVHDPGVPHGIAYGNGAFVSVFGLGQPGRVLQTTDALHWKTVYDVSYSTFGGVRFGSGTFVMASEPVSSPVPPGYKGVSLSSNDGVSWTRDGDVGGVRALAYYGYDTGRFLSLHDSGTRYTTDKGKTWLAPTNISIDCSQGVSWGGGAVYGNGILITLSQFGTVCRSTDGGATWTIKNGVTPAIASNGIWADNQFMFWTNANDRDPAIPGDDGFYRYTSADGQTWQKTKMTSKVSVGPVVRTPSGQFVTAVGFLLGYEEQKFYTSSDGLTWTESTQSAPVENRHGIAGIAVGEVDRTPGCGL